MYISYSTINGHLYAQLAESERNGNTIRKLTPPTSAECLTRKRASIETASAACSPSALPPEPTVAVKKMNDIYKLFKVKCPDEIPLKERPKYR